MKSSEGPLAGEYQVTVMISLYTYYRLLNFSKNALRADENGVWSNSDL